MAKDCQTVEPTDDNAVDYRFGAPWDFGLAPQTLRRVAACTKARIAQAQHWPAPHAG